MQSKATTVDAYLAELPEERRAIVSAMRDLVLAALPEGYEETMNWGMISYEVPLERYPDTYNKQPLGVAALASQKNHCALYLHGAYMKPELTARIQDGFKAAGKKLDMGKSCLRFKRMEDVAEDAVSDVVAALDPNAFIELYESIRKR